MVFILSTIATFAFILIAVIFIDGTGFKEILASICIALGTLTCIATIAMGIAVIIANIGVDGQIAAKQQLHDSLVYQLENNLYDNDNDVGKQELYEKVTEWNTDLARGKALQHDLWIGIFYSDIYDQFDFIDLSLGSK